LRTGPVEDVENLENMEDQSMGGIDVTVKKLRKKGNGAGTKKTNVSIEKRIEIGKEMERLKIKDAQDKYLLTVGVKRKRALEYQRQYRDLQSRVQGKGLSVKKVRFKSDDHPEVDSALYLWFSLQTSAHPKVSFSNVEMHLKANEIYFMFYPGKLDYILRENEKPVEKGNAGIAKSRDEL
jgi:hypothetical protein